MLRFCSQSLLAQQVKLRHLITKFFKASSQALISRSAWINFTGCPKFLPIRIQLSFFSACCLKLLG